jgi:hypothetical protein
MCSDKEAPERTLFYSEIDRDSIKEVSPEDFMEAHGDPRLQAENLGAYGSWPRKPKHGAGFDHGPDCFGCKIRTLSFGIHGRYRNKVEEAIDPETGKRVKATTGTDGSIHIEHHDREQLTVPHPKERK